MASQLGPPKSQKAGERPISFLLDNEIYGTPLAFVDLVIRPEDLTRTDPSRIAVHQTLGGAWADSFGSGIAQISISGHTGWRRDPSNDDGMDRFNNLKEKIYKQWHEQRAANVDAGLDPNECRLILTDVLNGTTDVVAPMSFVLRRNRARPLLFQYQLSLLVLESDSEPAGEGNWGGEADDQVDFDDLEEMGLESMDVSIGDIQGSISGMALALPSSMNSLVGPIQGFMGQSSSLFGGVSSMLAGGAGIASSLLGVSQLTSLAGLNLFRNLAGGADVSQIGKSLLMAVAGSYSNVFCVMANALQQKQFYGDFSGLYGSSNCSSTSGGRPLSGFLGENPFYSVVPTVDALPISMTPGASGALGFLAGCDPVLAPLSTTSMFNSLSSITGGLTLSI